MTADRKRFAYRIQLSDGLAGVQRIVQTVRQRQHDVVWMRSYAARNSFWLTDIVVVSTEDDVRLLVKRLNRLPCVVRVLPRRHPGTLP